MIERHAQRFAAGASADKGKRSDRREKAAD
jgi:hypothetical protein